MLLSIAIPSHNKSFLLDQAIKSILKEPGLGKLIEIVISDNSLNNEVENLFLKNYKKYEFIKYFKSQEYECLDSNVNRCVELSTGEYVWIFGDDDLIVPGILADLISFLKDKNPNLLVLNSKSFRNNQLIEDSRRPLSLKTVYNENENDQFLIDMAGYLTYVGAILVRKDLWISYYDKSKIGTFFSHIVCLSRIKSKRKVYYFRRPAIQMRLGNQTWTSQAFIIWYKFYPEIIWGLSNYSNHAKEKIISLNPINSIKVMLAARAYGRLDTENFFKYIINSKKVLIYKKYFIFLISIIPEKLIRIIYIIYILLSRKKHTINFSPKLALAQLGFHKN